MILDVEPGMIRDDYIVVWFKILSLLLPEWDKKRQSNSLSSQCLSRDSN
jgi:hypothetical protein